MKRKSPYALKQIKILMDNGLGGGGKVSGFQLTGMIDLDDGRIFLGSKFSNSRTFLGW